MNGPKARNLIRMDGREISSIEEFGPLEEVLGDYGGRIASFERGLEPEGRRWPAYEDVQPGNGRSRPGDSTRVAEI